jgi:hypothetical protein
MQFSMALCASWPLTVAVETGSEQLALFAEKAGPGERRHLYKAADNCQAYCYETSHSFKTADEQSRLFHAINSPMTKLKWLSPISLIV